MQNGGCRRGWIAVVLACVAPLSTQPRVCINEFMASNSTCLATNGGRYEDWIELHNPGSAPVDVAGMFLTDDLDDPTQWRIPTGRTDETTIPAGGFLLIWADNNPNAPGLHANFKLSSDGEEIALFDTDGVTLADYIAFAQQTSDISFGRYPGAGTDWIPMAGPTPGAANSQTFAGFVADVTFSAEHGFYDEPFDVTLTTATEDAQIWYTLGGTAPKRTETGQFDALPYDEPIRVEHTTCIRAIAARPGWKDSTVTSCTYLFIDDIPGQLATPTPEPVPPVRRRSLPGGSLLLAQSSTADPALRAALTAIPSVCIVMEPNDFFDPLTGINANPTRRGIEWERPASIEWVDPVDPLSFQVNAGLRIHGGVSRNTPGGKHSLRMLFKGQYGPSMLDAPIFKDCNVTQFDSLILRCTLHDSWTGAMGGRPQYMRDPFSRDTMRDMDRLTPYGRPVHVYINGLYWGLFILTERPDDGFAAAHLGGDKEQYDALKARSVSDPDPSVVEVVAGDLAAWNAMFDLADAGLDDPIRYDRFCQYLDIPSFIDYMLMVFYIGTTDGPSGFGGPPRNFWAVRPRTPGGGFIFLAWDLEFSLNNLNENLVTVPGAQDPHFLFHQLAMDPEFRTLVADHIHRQFFHGALTSQSSIERYLARAADVEKAIWAEAFRWGADQQPSTVNNLCNNWRAERDRIIEDYFPSRGGIVVEQLRQAGLYPNVEAPVLEIEGTEQYGGPTRAGASLAIDNPDSEGRVYYTTDGSDPRTTSHPADVNALVPVVPANAEKRVFVPQQDIGRDWTGGSEPYDDASWTAGTPIVPGAGGAVGYTGGRVRDPRISYNVALAMSKRTSCYVRIPFAVAGADLPGISHLALRVQCDDGFIAYINGVEMASINRPAALAWNSTCSDRPNTAGSVWVATPGIANLLHPGHNILAIHALNATDDSFFLLAVEMFGSDEPIFGEGISASACEYAGPVELTRSVQIKARAYQGGQWSPVADATFAVGPVMESLRISEIMYHPPEPNDEFVELVNTGAESIDLSMVHFAGGIDFVFPGLLLTPGEHTLVVRDVQAFTDRYGPGLNIAGQYEGALANEGERITLRDAIGRTILDFTYDDAWYGSTDGKGYSLECLDPNGPSDKDSWRPSLQAGGSPGRQ
ncbi:MAG: CotH kinase family protein [Sedimentisphaerales bacterium]|nr:CotH kinase family protein [Sedimentisphaerales bacterium]